MDVSPPEFDARFLGAFLRRIRKSTVAPMRPRNATPPTTPPAMTPLLVLGDEVEAGCCCCSGSPGRSPSLGLVGPDPYPVVELAGCVLVGDFLLVGLAFVVLGGGLLYRIPVPGLAWQSSRVIILPGSVLVENWSVKQKALLDSELFMGRWGSALIAGKKRGFAKDKAERQRGQRLTSTALQGQ